MGTPKYILSMLSCLSCLSCLSGPSGPSRFLINRTALAKTLKFEGTLGATYGIPLLVAYYTTVSKKLLSCPSSLKFAPLVSAESTPPFDLSERSDLSSQRRSWFVWGSSFSMNPSFRVGGVLYRSNKLRRTYLTIGKKNQRDKRRRVKMQRTWSTRPPEPTNHLPALVGCPTRSLPAPNNHPMVELVKPPAK